MLHYPKFLILLFKMVDPPSIKYFLDIIIDTRFLFSFKHLKVLFPD